MRRSATLIVISLLTVGLLGLINAAPSSAAANRLKIEKITAAVAAPGGTSTIRPKVTRVGKIKVKSKTITVTRGTTVIATNRTAVALRAGTYRVKTTAKYRSWKRSDGRKVFSKVKTKTRVQTVIVKQRAAVQPAPAPTTAVTPAPVEPTMDPVPVPVVVPPTTGGTGNDPRFQFCYQANAAGFGNYRSGVDPEYGWYNDRDHDGIVCEF